MISLAQKIEDSFIRTPISMLSNYSISEKQWEDSIEKRPYELVMSDKKNNECVSKYRYWKTEKCVRVQHSNER